MALEFRDRVSDTSSTTGTGTLTLDNSPPSGYRGFSAHTSGATVRYCISDASNWEVGQGVWTSSGSTLTRAKVFASSNSGSLVSFAAGTKSVTTVPAAADFQKPVFKAHRGSSQTVSANTWTKMQLSTVDFDTTSAFDATTNYRFTPLVAGYYQFSGQVNVSPSQSRLICALRKNGTDDAIGSDAGTAYRSTVNALVYLNGSTDYVELWGYTAGTSFIASSAADMYLTGFLAVHDA